MLKFSNLIKHGFKSEPTSNCQLVGILMVAVLSRKVVTTDASLIGWGSVHEGRDVRGSWGVDLWHLHINFLGLLAVFLSLKCFLPFLRDHHVLIRTDNTTTVAHINRQGGLVLSSIVCAGAQIYPLEQRSLPFPEGNACSGESELWGRHALSVCRCTGNGPYIWRWWNRFGLVMDERQ